VEGGDGTVLCARVNKDFVANKVFVEMPKPIFQSIHSYWIDEMPKPIFKKSNQTCFQNFNLLKMKTVFRNWKQEMKTENKNANQTHP